MSNIQKKSAEDEIVQIIREYFDDKAKYDRVDKLSQAYLYINLTDEDLEKIKSLEWKKKKLEDKKNSISNKKDKKSEKELQELEEELKELDNLKIKCQNMTLYKLRYLFKAYCNNPEFIPNINFPNLLKTKWWKCEDSKGKVGEVLFWLSERPDGILKKWLWQLAKQGTVLSAVFGLFQYIGDIPKRQQQNYFQAWQLINTASTQPGQAGQVEALEYLNKDKFWFFTPKCKQKDNECLVGVKIQKANLNKVNLEGANLTSSEFQHTSFRGANLKNTNLKDANFKDAHLECADFSGAKDVNLDGAIKCKTKMADSSEDNSGCKTIPDKNYCESKK
jgi:Pentapeptide repeats (8 copies)